jgi:N-acetylglutamate synthase-like GNAT family acetyltransferase
MGKGMIRQAEPQDLPAVLALLTAADLPTDGVADHFHSFFVVDDGQRIVASAGLELRGDAALLRSLAVSPDVRSTGLGAAVLRRALHEANDRAEGVYALTTTAEGYLSRFGFERVSRSSVPAPLLESRELQGACPSSATVMKWVTGRGQLGG